MTDHDAIAAKVRQDRETGTPGPWQSGIIEDGGPFAVGDRDCWPICKMAAAPGPHNGANARRIATLPDLEEAYLDLYDEVKRLRAERDAKQVKRPVPAGQTPLDDKLNHRFLDVVREGAAARDAGTASPYHGHSLEHCLHATGWVLRDLRLALDEARARAEKAEAERDRLRAALTIYAQSVNWRLGGCCDPNSPNFTGEDIARAALKGDSDE